MPGGSCRPSTALARPLGPRAPLVGRTEELELLENTFERALRDRRAHIFTIFGEPGVGKSRLAREFIDGVERASCLVGRALPYGEGVTYWPLAEMVKAAAGITDDDPLDEAFEKLRECCAEEAIADVLGLAAGMMEALEGERSPQEIAWASREVMESIADVQPLILLFEDIHWAEEPLLDLIEHLADWVRAPLLIVCLARPELLDTRPGWGGGRVRSTAIELEPLSEEESEALVEKLLGQLAGQAGEAPSSLPREILERAEGNPLFVEETIRMFLESGSDGDPDRIPDTLQALIAARIDHLSPPAKTLLQRASVIGRVFYRGALDHLAPDLDDLDALLGDLLLRDLLLREPRSSISGEAAYRFKHFLIREVAYTGLAKLARAQHHARFADWLSERQSDELLEIRAYHLDQAVELLTELEGAPPERLAEDAASALVKAAKRATAREAYANARKLALRALELRPSLGARYVAARAAWRLSDFATVESEMAKVRSEAQEQGETVIEALALTGLGEAMLRRSGDPGRAKALVDEALELLKGADDPAAHFDALMVGATIGAWRGEVDAAVRHLERGYGIAIDSRRKDLQTIAAQALVQLHIGRLELDEAELLITRALELAGESGSVRARVSTTLSYGKFLLAKDEIDAAETIFEEVRTTAVELGLEPVVAHAHAYLSWAALRRGDVKRAEKHAREAVRITASRGDRGMLPEIQALLACALADAGQARRGRAPRARSAGEREPRGSERRGLGDHRARGRPRRTEGRRRGRGAVRGSPLAGTQEPVQDARARPAETRRPVPARARARRGGRGLRGAAGRARAHGEHRADRLTRALVGGLGDHRRRSLESRERVPKWLGAKRALSVGQVLGLVAVRERDVREVDVERGSLGEHLVDRPERGLERLRVEIGAVARRVHVREVEDGAHPADATRDLDHVLERPEVAHATHDLDPERHCATLRLEPLPERPELLDDGRDGILARSSEQEAGMEHDELGAARGHDAGAPVERADRGGELASARLQVPHEAEERRVHRERDVRLPRELAEPLGERVVHPEPALEVDLARGVPALEEKLDRVLGRLPRGAPGGADTDAGRHRAILVPLDVIPFRA